MQQINVLRMSHIQSNLNLFEIKVLPLGNQMTLAQVLFAERGIKRR